MTAQAPWRWTVWRRWPGRVLLVVAVLALAWTSLGWWLPGVLKPRIERAATEALGVPVTLQHLALQPWTLTVEAGGLQVGTASAPLFKLGQARTQLSLASLWHHAPVLRSISLQAPQLWVQRLEAQRFNFTPVLERLRQPSPTPPSSEPARFALHNIAISDGAVVYEDHVLHTDHRIEALALNVPFLSNLASDIRTEVQPALSARIDGSRFALGGEAQPFAPDRPATLKLDWHGVQLAEWAALVSALLPPDQAPQLQRGQLDTQLQITFQDPSGPTPARLRVQGQLTVQDLQVALPPGSTGQIEARWQRLSVEGLDLAPLEQRYRVGAVTLQGLRAELRREKTPPAPAAKATETPAPQAAASTVHWQVERVGCEDCEVRWHDTAVAPAVQLALAQSHWTLGPLSDDLSQPIQLQLEGRLGGPLKVQASIVPAARRVVAKIDLGGFALAPLQPYFAPYVNLRLVGGQLSAVGDLTLDGPHQRYQGRLAVDGLKTQDSVTGADFVGWRQLAFDGLDLRLPEDRQPGDFDLGRIRLDGLRAVVILHPDAHLNLADVSKKAASENVSVTSPAPGASAPGQRRSTTGAGAGTAAAERPPLRWRAIEIRDGNVHFTDRFIRPNYSAQLTRLKGEISAVDARRPEPARVALTGALDDGAPVRIAGSVNPLAQPLYVDLEGGARGIALTRLSAYAERYVGYTIDKGTLSMTVRYHVEQGKLDAQNQLFLDQFNFGEKVDSPEATSLPVRLAVALLKNRRGEIDVRLPISGTLDDPQFSIGGLLWRAFVNLLTRAATAPFALLAGDDATALDRVDFAPGSPELDDAARKALDKLAQQLEEHPELKLDITGHADPARDAPPPPAGAASAPAAAASAPPPDPTRLKTLADARADRVLTYLATRIDPQRLLLSRSKLETPEGPAGTGVVLELR